MRGAMDKITIRRITDVTNSGSVNDEGFLVVTPVDTEVSGSFHIRKSGTDELIPNEVGRFGEILRGVVRIPLSTDIRIGDLVVIDALQDKFDGVYEIENIQYTRTHLRVEIRKSRA